MANVKIIGGRKLRQFIRNAKSAKSRDVEVGFFETAKYPTGQFAATVAAWNEFGTKRIPERPFFRRALEAAKSDVRTVLRENIDSETMTIDAQASGLVGEVVKGHIQTSITALKSPPNAPRTVAQKGSSNPLIDTGFMRAAATYIVKSSKK